MTESVSFKDVAIIVTPFLIFLLGIGVAIIGYFLKGIIADLKSTKEKAGKVEKDLLEFKAQLPYKFILKDDYIRAISVFEKKLDDIKDSLFNLVKEDNDAKSRL